MNKIHYQDDFSVTVTLKETGGRSIDPSYITDIEFSTRPSVKHLCTVEDKSVVTIDSSHVAAYLNAHKLPPGRLKAIVHYRLPNEAYKDGYQDIYSCCDPDTTLVEGAGDTTYVEMVLATGLDTAALATALEGKADKSALGDYATIKALQNGIATGTVGASMIGVEAFNDGKLSFDEMDLYSWIGLAMQIVEAMQIDIKDKVSDYELPSFLRTWLGNQGYCKVWQGTQSAYDAISDKDDQTLYCITS